MRSIRWEVKKGIKKQTMITVKTKKRISVKEILKKVRPRGVTVMDRLRVYAYATKKDITKITVGQKSEIGILIKDKYFSDTSRKKKFVRKIYVSEPEGTFIVLAYPSRFTCVIDAIINKYFLKSKDWRKRKTIKIQ